MDAIKENASKQRNFLIIFVAIFAVSAIFWPLANLFLFDGAVKPPVGYWGIYVVGLGPVLLFCVLSILAFQQSREIKKYGRWPLKNNVLSDAKLVVGEEAKKLAGNSYYAGWVSVFTALAWGCGFLYWIL